MKLVIIINGQHKKKAALFSCKYLNNITTPLLYKHFVIVDYFEHVKEKEMK